MKRFFTATCIVAACAVGLAAQSGQSSTKDRGHQAKATRATLTGCIQVGQEANTFVLTHVTGMPADQKSTGSTASSSTGTAGHNPREIMLDSTTKVDLSKHVGHEVQVTGTLTHRMNQLDQRDNNPGSSSSGGAVAQPGQSTGATGGSTMTSGQAIGGRPTESLMVNSLKMVSDSCSDGK